MQRRRCQPAGGRWLAACLLCVACCQISQHALGDDALVSSSSIVHSHDAESRASDATADASARIDELVAAQLHQTGIVPAPRSSDAEFVRRIYLDLVGRTPSLAEYTAFVGSKEPDKRTLLIDQLLASHQHARHVRDLLDAMLVGGTLIPFPDRTGWLDYLESSVYANKPWDQVVRELLTSDGVDPATRPQTAFFVTRRGNVDAMTTDTSRLFLGVQLQCARCHDHPTVYDWSQDRYYGMAAFWVRSSLFPKNKELFVAEKADGAIKFQPMGEEEITAEPVFLTGQKVVDPELDDDNRYLVKPAKGAKLPPRPTFSLRTQFAELTTSPDNPYFQRAMVNRVFRWLLGRGLVEPVDNMHSENPSSHPELLVALGEDFASHGFDLRRLIRGVVRSDAYQRSSQWNSAEDSQTLPDESSLACALLKPITARQLAASVLQACGLPDAELSQNPEQAIDDVWLKLEERITPFEALFDDGRSADFQATTEQALFLANSEPVQACIRDDRLGSTRHQLLSLDDSELVSTLFRAVLSREPEPAERDAVSAYLQSWEGSRDDAVNDLLWSLLASSEFRFNH